METGHKLLLGSLLIPLGIGFYAAQNPPQPETQPPTQPVAIDDVRAPAIARCGTKGCWSDLPTETRRSEVVAARATSCSGALSRGLNDKMTIHTTSLSVLEAWYGSPNATGSERFEADDDTRQTLRTLGCEW